MRKVFVLQHLHIQKDGSEDVKLVGVYSTRALVEEAVKRLGELPGFCDSPDICDPLTNEQEEGFYIDEYVLDKDYWETGFITVH